MAIISWFIPSLIKGSGGHRTMLQHAEYLESKGHVCHIYLEDETGIGQAADKIKSLFSLRFNNVFYGWNSATPSDICIATIWYSAAFVAALPFDCKRIYFVQDFEAWFNPMGDAYLMAENSYQYNLTPITIGRWLRHELKHRFNVYGYHFEFGANLSIYHPVGNIKKEKAICFIHQPDKPRRCSRLGLEALGIVKHRYPDVNIYLYGSDGKSDAWFEHTNLGLINLEQCNELYNRCRVGLCISSSNPSRIPFEMMAAGLPVVEIWRENNLYDFPPEAVLLANQTPESLAEAMIKVLADEDLNDKMSNFGAAYMLDRDLAIETQQFYDSINKIISGESTPTHDISRMYNIRPIKVPATRHDGMAAFNRVKPSLLRRVAMLLPPSLNGPLRKIYRFIKK
ncbi:glycosyltransferase family 4 protein [Biostraticola tofi]|uniref:WsaF C-terminal domain-containing protein n=1 Tax=Biostraticola tofi TaxID=466109 RepID=A0A4R3Z315_9GAMM|nr:glycosyltransferase family 4 protein [Biostraticola tofi]TCV98284.1 hypothetical protein EDC52_103376 [Biostraticola tofi]